MALGTSAIRVFRDWPVPVLYVLGNHEFYGRIWPDVLDATRRDAKATSVQLLERDAVELRGVRFIGATLWTDYLLSGPNLQPFLMQRAKAGISDHKLIRTRSGHLFKPADALMDHEFSIAWLEEQLSQPFHGATVVITHHGPHPGSIHQRFSGSDLNGSFVSNLAALVRKADVWIHGHVHDSFNYRVERCRVLANPQGYPRNGNAAETPAHLVFENNAFDPHAIIDI
jgi:hypothetical protein